MPLTAGEKLGSYEILSPPWVRVAWERFTVPATPSSGVK